MLTARQIDEAEQRLVKRGEAFFHLSGAGHEGSVALAAHLTSDDWLHCHYRDKALLLAWGIRPRCFFDALLCKASSSSQGRRMTPFMSDPDLHVLSMVTPVGNSPLQAVGVAAARNNDASGPIVVCGQGDGGTQQGEFFEACAEAVRRELPVLFFIENNGLAISTKTEGRTFFSLPRRHASDLLGMPIHRIDGREVSAACAALQPVVQHVRRQRQPSVVVFDVERLASHTNADDQKVYRPDDEIRLAAITGDPIRNLEQLLLEQGCPQSALDEIQQSVAQQVTLAQAEALAAADPEVTFVAKRPLPSELLSDQPAACPDEEDRPSLTMREAMNSVLRARLQQDERVTLHGEDIEDPKGDVFGVTRGLSSQFPGRVCNSALSESTIIGTSIGRALAGERPVAFIQFADFLPPALNQIICELGTMYWRTGGQWQCPVIVMVACGGYRPGLGPFHAQTFESLSAQLPGVDVFMPSDAADAAGLLNAAFDSQRPTLFFYPKTYLNDPQRATRRDVAQHRVGVGTSRRISRGSDLTIVTWGSTTHLCEKTVAALATVDVSVDLIDLRSISPWDQSAVCESVRRTGKLIVVHEDALTCGFGAEVLATVTEKVKTPVLARRVARHDTYVPCNFANQLEVLPSLKRILTVAAELMNLELTWELPETDAEHQHLVEAQGSSPADQSVTVLQWRISPGDRIQKGQMLATLEADKAVFELDASVAGQVEMILVPEGEVVPVGTPILRMHAETVAARRKPLTQEACGTPRLQRRITGDVRRASAKHAPPQRATVVGLSPAYVKEGRLRLENQELASRFHGREPEDIYRLTGIQGRCVADADQTVLSLAVEAAQLALDREQATISDVDAIIVSTTTPEIVTPSLACQVLNSLCRDQTPRTIPAHDVNAACSGYLYALASGYDFLQTRPEAAVLVVTSEVLSAVVDPQDFDTAILFGDAASATLMWGRDRTDRRRRWQLRRPVLSAEGEDGSVLTVPLAGQDFLKMRGKQVFTQAVRKMIEMLEQACDEADLQLDDLSLVIPHQANGRIIEAIRQRLQFPADRVFSNICEHGNTSSSSIPLCLADLSEQRSSDANIGLCAFGGGFTYGAAILETVDRDQDTR
jgi:2-oxoisovalerate dehydrogenase E1 component